MAPLNTCYDTKNLLSQKLDTIEGKVQGRMYTSRGLDRIGLKYFKAKIRKS